MGQGKIFNVTTAQHAFGLFASPLAFALSRSEDHKPSSHHRLDWTRNEHCPPNALCASLPMATSTLMGGSGESIMQTVSDLWANVVTLTESCLTE